MVSTCVVFDDFSCFLALSLFTITSISLVAGVQIGDREEADSIPLDLCSCQLCHFSTGSTSIYPWHSLALINSLFPPWHYVALAGIVFFPANPITILWSAVFLSLLLIFI